MTNIIITRTDYTRALVSTIKGDVTRDETRETITWPAWVKAHQDETNTVLAPCDVKPLVAALVALAYPDVKGLGNKRAEIGTDERRAASFADKCRNGLNRTIGKAAGPQTDPNLLKAIITATEKGVVGGLNPADIMAALEDLLS